MNIDNLLIFNIIILIILLIYLVYSRNKLLKNMKLINKENKDFLNKIHDDLQKRDKLRRC